MIVQVPNPYYIGKLGRLIINREEKLLVREREHKQAWDKVTLRNLLRQLGFGQTSFEYINYYRTGRRKIRFIPKIFGRTHLRVLVKKRIGKP